MEVNFVILCVGRVELAVIISDIFVLTSFIFGNLQGQAEQPGKHTITSTARHASER
jgi:hypothetical protein